MYLLVKNSVFSVSATIEPGSSLLTVRFHELLNSEEFLFYSRDDIVKKIRRVESGWHDSLRFYIFLIEF